MSNKLLKTSSDTR